MLLMGKSTISMAIFNSYVSLPEGNIAMDIIDYHWLSIVNEVNNSRDINTECYYPLVLSIAMENHHAINR